VIREGFYFAELEDVIYVFKERRLRFIPFFRNLWFLQIRIGGFLKKMKG
jgi:hypothetical protein